VGYLVFDLNNAKSALKKNSDDVATLTKNSESADHRLLNLSADFGVVKEKLGITQRELDFARAQALQIQREQQKSAQDLQAQLSKKAEADQVNRLKEETSSKIGAVSGEVTNVKSDVEKTKKDLESARRELLDVRDTLSSQIAHNASELNDLRRKGERNYIEFDLTTKQGFKKVGDIALRLTKVDQKKRKYSVMVSVDDNSLEKKDKTLGEPIQFLVGKNRLRYEIVVNQVTKSGVSGYLSIPKDINLSAENPRAMQ
jgi:chromosome segregation ATPase